MKLYIAANYHIARIQWASAQLEGRSDDHRDE
jgi:hypothetical protein